MQCKNPKVVKSEERLAGGPGRTDSIVSPNELSQWNKPLNKNTYFITAQKLGRGDVEAISVDGDSRDTCDLVLNIY